MSAAGRRTTQEPVAGRRAAPEQGERPDAGNAVAKVCAVLRTVGARSPQRLSDDLEERGFNATSIHGDLSQVLREYLEERFGLRAPESALEAGSTLLTKCPSCFRSIAMSAMLGRLAGSLLRIAFTISESCGSTSGMLALSCGGTLNMCIPMMSPG